MNYTYREAERLFFQLSLPAALPNPALKPNLEIFHRAAACDFFFFPGASHGTMEITVCLCQPPQVTPAVTEWMLAGETRPQLLSGRGEGAHIAVAQAGVWSLRTKVGASDQCRWVNQRQSGDGAASPPLL